MTDFDSPKSKAPKTLITSQQGGVFPISKPKLDKQDRAKFQHNFRIETGGDGDSHYILAAESKKLKKQWLAALLAQWRCRGNSLRSRGRRQVLRGGGLGGGGAGAVRKGGAPALPPLSLKGTPVRGRGAKKSKKAELFVSSASQID